jgi:hypothetical protein
MAHNYPGAGSKSYRSFNFGDNGGASVDMPAVSIVEHLRSAFIYGWDNDLSAAQQLPNVSTAVSADCTHAIVSVEGTSGGVRYRQDGSNPAATPSAHSDAGPFVPVGTAFVLALADLGQVRLIETDASVVINVEYCRVDQ